MSAIIVTIPSFDDQKRMAECVRHLADDALSDPAKYDELWHKWGRYGPLVWGRDHEQLTFDCIVGTKQTDQGVLFRIQWQEYPLHVASNVFHHSWLTQDELDAAGLVQ